MNLTDREILELNELCSAVVDGNLTDAQRARLSRWLKESTEARRFYVRALGQSASLHTYAAEMHAEAPDVPARIVRPIFAWWAAGLAAAAALAIGLWFSRAPLSLPSVSAPTGESVARLTASKDCAWSGLAASAPKSGERLGKGRRLELTAGFAEITFDSGARVVLQGPASLDVNSAWDGTLRRGTLTARVPAEAIGFRISNPSVEVVDLGTEFTMIADANGSTDVLVLKGEVEAAPRSSGDQDTILLREKESRRFASSGVSAVRDSERKFAFFNQPLALDRFVPTTRFVHWSFDDNAGDVLRADAPGMTASAFDAQLLSVDPTARGTIHPEGRRGRALHFDGKLQARANFPGISGSLPRTVAFWVKVPEDAQLSDAYSMVTWATNVGKLGNRPVGISWNRRPNDGPLGALRTDFGGGCAMGTTSLRDGRWHHVTVYFAPGDDPDAPVQVKQYVDGRLESSTIIPGTFRAKPGVGDAALTDTVWFGCRLSGQRQRDHFRGELDEIFIADRGLEPQEIVSLMNDNRFPASALAVAP